MQRVLFAFCNLSVAKGVAMVMEKLNKLYSGRITAPPNQIMDEMLLKPQFEFEVNNLLCFYKNIELAILKEQKRLGLLDNHEYNIIKDAIESLKKEDFTADSKGNFSDISFAFEENIKKKLENNLPPNWHLDKSRNDFQATAMRMYGAQHLKNSIHKTKSLVMSLHTLAKEYVEIPMPGFTHHQPAQIISPAFYLISISRVMLDAIKRLHFVLEDINLCPLGAGAMAGLELEWDRHILAKDLGFKNPLNTALVAISERDWMQKIAFEYSLIGNKISRFCTDFVYWSSYENKFIDLPDSMVGISSAMPQKKNFVILERIRGGCVHLNSFLNDFINTSQNSAYTNLVQITKEGSRYLEELFNCYDRVMTLFDLFISNLKFNEDQLLDYCNSDFFGAFSLANYLTKEEKIPYRASQKIVGEFVCKEKSKVEDLIRTIEKYDYQVTDDIPLEKFFDAKWLLNSKNTLGSTAPDFVKKELLNQEDELRRCFNE